MKSLAEEREKLSNSLIRAFRKEYKERVGWEAKVIVDKTRKRPPLSLQQICDVINDTIPPHVKDRSILAHNKIGEIIIRRQLFYKIARSYKYTFKVIGRFSGYDHTTVMHNCDVVENYLGSEPEAFAIYITILNKINDIRTLSTSGSSRDNSKPVLRNDVSSDEVYINTNQPISGVQTP